MIAATPIPKYSLRLQSAVLGLGLIFCGVDVRADSLDSWNVYASSSLTYDKNLFRVAPGDSPKSEVINANTVGVKVNKPYSLQRFELDANLVDYRYKNFNSLDFLAKNYSAAWRWSLTPNLRGNLTTNHLEALNNFADYQGRVRNMRTNDDKRFDADLDVGGGWHLLGGGFESVRKNSAEFIQESDSTLTSSETGVRYVSTAGSSLTYYNRIGVGKYNNRAQPFSSNLYGPLDNKFNQTENEFSFRWPVTAKTMLDGRIARLERSHEHYSVRDYSGNVGALNINWNITDKTRISGGFLREIAGFQSLYSSYSVTNRLVFNPVWQISAKTALRFRYDYGKRDYLGAIVSNALSDRKDTLRTGMIALDWQPMTAVTLSASLTDDTRSSNQSGYQYKDHIAFVSGQISF